MRDHRRCLLHPLAQQFPSDDVGGYFFADYCSGWIHRIAVRRSTMRLVTPASATGISRPVDLQVAEDGSLYYLARGSGSTTGVLSRVVFNGSLVPSITQQPASVTVSAGQPATFTVTASGATPLTYQWQRTTARSPARPLPPTRCRTRSRATAAASSAAW